jgi:hypothetical protein
LKKLIKKIVCERRIEDLHKYKWVLKGFRTSSEKLPITKFVIVTIGRTGSTLLTDLINRHNDVYCDGEIFSRKHWKRLYFPNTYLNGRSSLAFPKTCYGFKLKLEHLYRYNKIKNYALFFDKLNSAGWKIIHLKRNNILSLALSVCSAWDDNIYELKQKQSFHKKVINPKRLHDVVNFIQNLEDEEQNIVNKYNHIKFIYEDDLLKPDCHQETADKVFMYLGLKPAKVSTVFVKKGAPKLLENIQNSEEIVTYFKQTRYSKYLEL